MPPKKKESHAKRMAAQVRQHVGIENAAAAVP